MATDPPHTHTSGTLALGVGVLALIGYGVLGASPASPGLPTGQLALAALLVVAGVALRQGRGPRWGEFVAGALVGLLAYDLLSRLLG
jgi:peptidoglycan/LPS O-acetylase OafA/YrhL